MVSVGKLKGNSDNIHLMKMNKVPNEEHRWQIRIVSMNLKKKNFRKQNKSLKPYE